MEEVEHQSFDSCHENEGDDLKQVQKAGLWMYPCSAATGLVGATERCLGYFVEEENNDFGFDYADGMPGEWRFEEKKWGFGIDLAGGDTIEGAVVVEADSRLVDYREEKMSQ